jgi:ketosteroid isomerase-like protein
MIERAPEIEQEMREAFQMMQRGDLDALMERTSTQSGVVMIGSDPGEWYEGRDEIQQAMSGMRGADRLEMPTSTLDSVEAYRDGDVGWAAVRGAWSLGGHSVPFRLTAVMHREDGTWKAVQNHASVGVPNSEMMNPMFQAAGTAAS